MIEDNLIDNPEVYWAELMKEIASLEDIEEDAFIEAQIATVKELLTESIEAGDILGEYSFTSRLKELEEAK